MKSVDSGTRERSQHTWWQVALLGIVLAVVCAFLGKWQWDRHVMRDNYISLVESNYQSSAMQLSDLLTQCAQNCTDHEFQTVRLSGQYLDAEPILLRNRPLASDPGFHVLQLFVTTAGQTVTVNRGWWPAVDTELDELSPPLPPSGQVDLVARWRPWEPDSQRSAPKQQIQHIAYEDLTRASTDFVQAQGLIDGYVVLNNSDPGDQLPSIPKPDISPGSHLSYAFQWWIMGLGALIAFGRVAYLELRNPVRTKVSAKTPESSAEDDLIEQQIR